MNLKLYEMAINKLVVSGLKVVHVVTNGHLFLDFTV